MTDKMKKMEELLTRLRTEYIGTVSGKLSDIETALSQQDWQRLRAEFHKLKGSGKTHGLPAISDIARICEELLDSGQKDPAIVKLGIALIQGFTEGYHSTEKTA